VPFANREERLERLVGVGRSIVAELELDAILERVLETAQELTAARYAALGVVDESRRELARFVTRGIDRATHEQIGDLPRGRGILGILIDDPRPLRLAHVSDHPRSYGFPAHHPPMGSFLGVPITVRGEAWGNLYLTEKTTAEEFSEEDEQAAVILADWAAIAIDHSRLYASVDARRKELERAVLRFEATATIANAVGAEPDLGRLLELVVKRGRALVEARDVLVLLLDDHELVLAGAAGESAAHVGRRLPADVTPYAEAMARREPLRLAALSEQVREPLVHLGVIEACAALVVPLVYRGVPLGVLTVLDRLTGDGVFSADDESLMNAFAASTATAVATARTVTSERLRRSIEAAEAERRRWARELHDETLQGLAALKVQLAGARTLDDVEGMRAAIDGAVEHVSEEIADLRSLITDLRPAALDELGLLPALESLAERVRTVHGIEVALRVELDGGEDRRLPSEVEIAAYRIVQEALTNVGRHARARRADVLVEEAHGELHVRVVDDGLGFDAAGGANGFGLLGMSERAELLGGEVSVEADGREGAGTVVRARLPLNGSPF
jgi:signal transduction histidine kinase